MSTGSIDFEGFLAGDDHRHNDYKDDIMSETSEERDGRNRKRRSHSVSSRGSSRASRKRRRVEEDDTKKRSLLTKLDMKREMCRDMPIRSLNMGDSLEVIEAEFDKVERIESVKRAVACIRIMTCKTVNGIEIGMVSFLQRTYMKGWGETWGAQVSSGTHDSVIMRLAIQYADYFSFMPPWAELAVAIVSSGIAYGEVQSALASMEGTVSGPEGDTPIPEASGVMNGPQDIEHDLRAEAAAIAEAAERPVMATPEPPKRPKKKAKPAHRNDAVIDLF